MTGPDRYLLQSLASVLLADVLVGQQDLQQLLHGLLGGFQLLLLKLAAADLVAEGVAGHRDANRILAVHTEDALDRNLGGVKENRKKMLGLCLQIGSKFKGIVLNTSLW